MLIISAMWIVLSNIVSVLSVFLLAIDEELLTFLRGDFARVLHYFNASFGASSCLLIIEIIILALLCISKFILTVYASIALAHSFSKHRFLITFGAFIVINIITQVIMSFFVSMGIYSFDLHYNGTEDILSLHYAINITSLIQLIFCVLCFLLANYILKRHLNLE